MKAILLTVFLSAVSVLSATPQLRLSSAGTAPVIVNLGSTGATQTIEAYNAGDGSLNLNVSSSTPWISATLGPARACTTTSGTCIPIQIALNTASLAVGNYTGTVTVSDPAAIDSPQTINVTVQVGGVPSSLEFYVSPNGGTASAVILPRGAVTVTASTQDGSAWLAAAPGGQGVFSYFSPYTVKVTSQPGQAAGDYTGSVVIAGSTNTADNKTVTVKLHVTPLPIAQFASPTATFNSVQGGAKQTRNITVQNTGAGSLAIAGVMATAATGANWLTAAVVDNGTVSVTADPSLLAPGTYTGTVTLTSNAANNAAVSFPVQLTVAAKSAPIASFGGVVDNATFMPGAVSPGDIVAIFGSQFSSVAPGGGTAIPLVTTLNGTRVYMNNVPAPLYYTSGNQVDFQIPYETAPGQSLVSVERDGQRGNTVSLTVQAVAPRLLKFGAPNYGIIVNQDGSLVAPTGAASGSHPAKIGDALTIYAIGLGATTPAVATGASAPAAEPLARIVPTPTVLFGGGFVTETPGNVLFAGLTPNFVGLYQINVIVPPNLPTTGVLIPVTISLNGGINSNTVYIILMK